MIIEHFIYRDYYYYWWGRKKIIDFDIDIDLIFLTWSFIEPAYIAFSGLVLSYFAHLKNAQFEEPILYITFFIMAQYSSLAMMLKCQATEALCNLILIIVFLQFWSINGQSLLLPVPRTLLL